MNPKSEYVESFLVSGLRIRTANRDEIDPETAKIPVLWDRFMTEVPLESVPNALDDSPPYGVYANYASDADGLFDLTAGWQVSAADENGTFETVEVRSGEYLVFEGKGPLPEVVVSTWGEVWGYFERHPEVKRTFTTDFEVYRDQEAVAIYIAIDR